MIRKCKGVTKYGKRCSVTSSNQGIDDTGRQISRPLQNGGEYCLIHANTFCVERCCVDPNEMIVLYYLDLGATGVDIT